YTLTNGTPNAGTDGTISWTNFGALSASGIVDFQTTGSVTGDLTANTLDYSGVGGPIAVDLGANTASNTGGIVSISNIVGSGNAGDTLTGTNGGDTWATSAADAGSVAGVTFSSIENFTGGTGGDTFNLGHDVTGTVSGDAGNDNFNYNAGAIGTLAGGADSDTLTASNINNNWQLTGAGSGTLNGQGYIEMENLTGNVSDDDFNFNGGSVTGALDGVAGGTNTLDYVLVGGPIAVNLQTSAATSTGGFANIDTLVGSGNAGDTLTGANVPSTWNINAADGGNIGGAFTFSSIANVSGGTGNDFFVFTGVGDISGTVDGVAGGTNRLDYSGLAGPIAVNLQTNAVSNTGGIANINSLVGSAGNDVLTGKNTGRIFNITGADTGNINGNIAFSNVENLVGETGNDRFVVSGGTLSGGISGGAGDNALTGDNVVNTWTVTGVGIGAVTGIAGGFTGIENLVGGTADDTFNLQAGGDVNSINGRASSASDTLNLNGNFGAGGTPFSVTDIENVNANGAFSITASLFTLKHTSPSIDIDIGDGSTFTVNGPTNMDANLVVGKRVNFNGALKVTGDSTITVSGANNSLTIGGSVTGNSKLVLLASVTKDIDIGGSTDPLMSDPSRFSGFNGQIHVGGNEDQDPGLGIRGAQNIDITKPLSVNGDLSIVASQDLTINADVTAGGLITLVALGEGEAANGGSIIDGAAGNTAGGVIKGANSVMVAQNAVGEDGNEMIINVPGTLDFKFGADEAFIKKAAGGAIGTIETDGANSTAVAAAFGLVINSGTVTSVAQTISQVFEELFGAEVDESLFEEFDIMEVLGMNEPWYAKEEIVDWAEEDWQGFYGDLLESLKRKGQREGMSNEEVDELFKRMKEEIEGWRETLVGFNGWGGSPSYALLRHVGSEWPEGGLGVDDSWWHLVGKQPPVLYR
ncbi:MAG: hypothetical protein GY731_10490, partial [Gammaproteobacteria bacterium]|nr:hypothetical protein [Gammaproteobacteria bacterium]